MSSAHSAVSSLVPGQYHAGDAAILHRDVDHYLKEATHRPRAGSVGATVDEPPPKMLLVPHARYVCCGALAAQAYAQIRPWADRIRRVVLIGPVHRQVVLGLVVPSCASFESPLGPVPLDTHALARLSAWRTVRVDDAAHAMEHSLSVQLPFLQVALDRFVLLPLAVGLVDAAELAELLFAVWGGPETLIVVSSDLSRGLDQGAARERDQHTLASVLALDPVLDGTQACGAHALNGALLAARQQGLRPRLLGSDRSPDRGDPRGSVVGHAAVVFEEPSVEMRVAAHPLMAAMR